MTAAPTFHAFAAEVLDQRGEEGIRGIRSERAGGSSIWRRPSRAGHKNRHGSMLITAYCVVRAVAQGTSVRTRFVMPKAVDLTGLKFNLLTVIAFVGSRRSADGHMRRTYLVRCDCGTEKELAGIYIASGTQKSCGCLRRNSIASVTHGETRGGWTPEYRAWQSMISRCHRTGSSGFVKYGAKGTRVCDEWRASYEAFLSHVGRKPTPAHSLDRIDPWGHYEPGNVRWATPTEQANNQRQHHPRSS